MLYLTVPVHCLASPVPAEHNSPGSPIVMIVEGDATKSDHPVIIDSCNIVQPGINFPGRCCNMLAHVFHRGVFLATLA